MERWMYEYLRKEKIEERCKNIAQWLIDDPSYSVRKLSKEFMISKSQVHRDLHNLRNIDDYSYVQVMNILKRHKNNKF